MRLPLNQTIETREPTIEVDPGLEPGRHRFQLEVFDEAGNRSRPAVVIVEIQRSIVEPTRPTDPLIDPIRAPAVPPVPAGKAARRAAPVRKPRRPRRKE
jgi:hypothetical protein